MEKTNLTILVTGATGKQGGSVARHLLKDGWKVRAVTRDKAKPEATELAALGAEVVQADMNDPVSLKGILNGVYGVFSVQNFWEHGYEGELKQGINLIDAAKEADVKHYVMASVASADKNTGLPHFDVKVEIEDHLKACGMPYTILRPVFFMENFSAWFKPVEDNGRQKLVMAMKENTKLQMVAVDDIGVFVKLIFDNPQKYSGKTIELAGDDISMPEVAKAYTNVFGKETVFEELPLDVLRQNSEELAMMFQWFQEKGYEANIPELKETHPGLKSFEKWLESTRN